MAKKFVCPDHPNPSDMWLLLLPASVSSAGLLLGRVRAPPTGRRLSPAMQLGGAGKVPPEVTACLKPAYEGAARGGEPFVAGTMAELTAIWKAMVKVYGSREEALTACKKNQQVYLPYINTPECIIGAHGALISINGKDWAAEIIRKNPGVLACNPKTLATVPLSTVTPSRKPHDGHALS